MSYNENNDYHSDDNENNDYYSDDNENNKMTITIIDSNLRAKNTFNAPTCRTNRFQNSFLIRNSIMHSK